MAASTQITPEVTWAQRSSATEADKNFIYLTIAVPDVPKESLKLDLQATSLNFTGHSDTKKATYHVAFDFFSEIEPKESKVHHSGRDIEMKLQKKELKEEYWPRLLKEKAKVHWLKTDFDKWVDEDEQNAQPEEDYMNQFGGAGGPPGADGGFGGLDFSKLGIGGGAGGMPDLSALGAGAGGMDEDEDDDEEMPELEDEAGSKAGSSSKKIEEVE